MFFLKKLLKYSWFTILGQSLLQQSDSLIHMCTFFFYVLFHYGWSQNIQYSSLCYTGGPCCLSILNVIVCNMLLCSMLFGVKKFQRDFIFCEFLTKKDLLCIKGNLKQNILEYHLIEILQIGLAKVNILCLLEINMVWTIFHTHIHTHTCRLLLFSHMSNSLQPHGLQHARLPCPPPRASSNPAYLRLLIFLPAIQIKH